MQLIFQVLFLAMIAVTAGHPYATAHLYLSNGHAYDKEL